MENRVCSEKKISIYLQIYSVGRLACVEFQSWYFYSRHTHAFCIIYYRSEESVFVCCNVHVCFKHVAVYPSLNS